VDRNLEISRGSQNAQCLYETGDCILYLETPYFLSHLVILIVT
jgi:hypothetical protein